MPSRKKRRRNKRTPKKPHKAVPGSDESGTALPERAERPEITGPRKWAFRLITVIVAPALFIVLVELGLRLFGYGYPADFFVKMPGRHAFTTNQRFGWRFFPPAMARTPVVCELPAEKAEGTYRIFVLGGSVARGTPSKAFGFGRMLGAMLQERYPQTRFELVNTAMTAINSHVVLPIARDCAGHRPDLFVIYMGNNEVVGPYGSGTIFGGFSGSLRAIRAGVYVKSTRIGQLLGSMIRRGGDSITEWKGMMMFLEQRVSAGDPRMETVYNHFRANLADICDAARQSGAKVILCTVPVNLKDCAPFAAMHRADIEESERKQWTEFYTAGITLAKAGKHAEAAETFGRAMRFDDRHAELHFRLARSLLELERFEEAREHFVFARDLDVLRFRADTRINRIIREVAREYAHEGVYLVDAKQAFEQSEQTQQQIPGRELFYEHVHVTPEGNYLLAKACFEQTVSVLPDSVRRGIGAVAAPSKDRCLELIALTDWDRYQMQQEISAMLWRAPFSDQLDAVQRRMWRKKLLAELRVVATSPTAMDKARQWYVAAIERTPDDPQLHRRFAYLLKERGDYGAAVRQWRYLLKRFPNVAKWHLEFAELLKDHREFANAIAEFREAMRIDRFLSDVAYAGIGSTLVKQDKWTEAEQVFREALASNPKLPMAHSSLGVILYEQGKHAEAIRHFQQALEIDPDLAIPHNNLALAFAKQDNFPEAVRHYREFLRIEPDDLVVRHNLAFSLAEMGKTAEGISEYRRVLQQRPDYVPALTSLARILAACEDPQFRDGAEAVQIMERVCRQTGYTNPMLLDTLAIAYAEAGQFDKAIATAEKALRLAQAKGAHTLVSQLQHGLSLYKQAKPYRRRSPASQP